MASWSQSKFYGYAAIRIGYAPRFLTGRGPAYFEAPSFKFLNSFLCGLAGNIFSGTVAVKCACKSVFGICFKISTYLSLFVFANALK